MGYKSFWDSEIETLPVNMLKKLQLKKLKDTVANVYENSPFYRKLYREAGVSPTDISCLEDIRKLPFTDKEKIRSAFPYGLALKPKEHLVEVHTTSGTTGKPVPVFATRKDIERWGELNARNLWMIGIRPGDVLQNAFGYGLPTGGLGFHYGAVKLGAMVIPIGTGQVDRQIDTIIDFGVTALCMTPTFCLYIAQRASDRNIDLKQKSNLKLGLFGAEPWPESTRTKIQSLLGIEAFDEYGMTELLGPGMSCECTQKDGLHVWADCFLVECVDPDTGEVLPEGEEGELVWTWLCSDGTAVIRYRSRDLGAIRWGKCPCGRTHPKITRIKGRSDDAFNVNGFIIFPSQVEEVLVKQKGVGSNFKILLEKDDRGLDKMTLLVERDSLDSRLSVTEALEREIRNQIKAVTGVTCTVKLVEPYSLPRAAGGESKTASHRVEDLRNES